MAIIYPEKIEKDALIGITAVSAGVTEQKEIKRLENAYLNFARLGYEIFIETPNVRTNYKFVSSDGKTRAKEFMDLWKNSNVKWIIAASGGEFLVEMLPYIDKEVIKSNTPKWVEGYSNTSSLNYYLTTNYNIATVHSINVRTFGMRELDPSILKTIEVLENCNESVQESYKLYESRLERTEGMELEPYNLTEKVEYKNLYGKSEDKISGRILGGCLDDLRCLVGTKFDNTVNFCNQFNEGMLWYLENCEMSVADVYRALWQMREAGWFENAKGFLIGRTASRTDYGEFTYLDSLHNALDELNVPVIYDVDIGHIAPQWTMINGAFGEFEYKDGKGKIVEKMI